MSSFGVRAKNSFTQPSFLILACFTIVAFVAVIFARCVFHQLTKAVAGKALGQKFEWSHLVLIGIPTPLTLWAAGKFIALLVHKEAASEKKRKGSGTAPSDSNNQLPVGNSEGPPASKKPRLTADKLPPPPPRKPRPQEPLPRTPPQPCPPPAAPPAQPPPAPPAQPPPPPPAQPHPPPAQPVAEPNLSPPPAHPKPPPRRPSAPVGPPPKPPKPLTPISLLMQEEVSILEADLQWLAGKKQERSAAERQQLPPLDSVYPAVTGIQIANAHGDCFIISLLYQLARQRKGAPLTEDEKENINRNQKLINRMRKALAGVDIAMWGVHATRLDEIARISADRKLKLGPIYKDIAEYRAKLERVGGNNEANKHTIKYEVLKARPNIDEILVDCGITLDEMIEEVYALTPRDDLPEEERQARSLTYAEIQEGTFSSVMVQKEIKDLQDPSTGYDDEWVTRLRQTLAAQFEDNDRAEQGLERTVKELYGQLQLCDPENRLNISRLTQLRLTLLMRFQDPTCPKEKLERAILRLYKYLKRLPNNETIKPLSGNNQTNARELLDLSGSAKEDALELFKAMRHNFPDIFSPAIKSWREEVRIPYINACLIKNPLFQEFARNSAAGGNIQDACENLALTFAINVNVLETALIEAQKRAASPVINPLTILQENTPLPPQTEAFLLQTGESKTKNNSVVFLGGLALLALQKVGYTILIFDQKHKAQGQEPELEMLPSAKGQRPQPKLPTVWVAKEGFDPKKVLYFAKDGAHYNGVDEELARAHLSQFKGALQVEDPDRKAVLERYIPRPEEAKDPN